MANWFVGMPVAPAGARHGWLERLLASAPPHVRRFAPDDVHLTVAFLGRAGEEAARRAWAIAEAYRGPALSVTLGGLVPMGDPRRPSALSLALTDGADEATALIRALRDPMIAAAGARPERRAPKPHVTVARPKRAASPREREEAVAWAKAAPPLGLPVVLDTLALYTWSDDRAVRQFRAVATRRLE